MQLIPNQINFNESHHTFSFWTIDSPLLINFICWYISNRVVFKIRRKKIKVRYLSGSRLVQILRTKRNCLILKVKSITIESPDSVKRLVQILHTKINCLILKLKSITIGSPGSVTREYHAHKRIFGADNFFLVDNNYLSMT